MVFKGTDARTPGAFDREFERMGGEASAQTTRDATVFRVTVLPERWKDALAVWGEMLAKPAFRDADWLAERAVIRREIGVAQSDATKLGLQTLSETAYPDGDPFRQPIMGGPANIDRFTPSDLRTFHAARYAAANLTVVICGPVSALEAASAVNERFPATKGRAVSVGVAVAPVPTSFPTIPTRAPLFTDDEQTTRELATVYLGFRAPRIQTDPNGAAACEVLTALLGRGAGGILGGRLLGDKALDAVSVGTEYLPQTNRALFVINATGAKRDIGRIEDAIVDEIKALAGRPAGADAARDGALAAAKESVLGAERYRRETVEGEAQYLAYLDMLGVPGDYAERYAGRVRAVSPADLTRLLTDYVSPAKRVVGVTGITALSRPATGEATP